MDEDDVLEQGTYVNVGGEFVKQDKSEVIEGEIVEEEFDKKEINVEEIEEAELINDADIPLQYTDDSEVVEESKEEKLEDQPIDEKYEKVLKMAQELYSGAEAKMKSNIADDRDKKASEIADDLENDVISESEAKRKMQEFDENVIAHEYEELDENLKKINEELDNLINKYKETGEIPVDLEETYAMFKSHQKKEKELKKTNEELEKDESLLKTEKQMQEAKEKAREAVKNGNISI